MFSPLNAIPDLNIEGIAYDSREVKPGYLFVALKGKDLDGNDYIYDAISRGAVAVVSEQGTMHRNNFDVPVIMVINSRKFLSKLAVKFYRRPFEGMNIIGITGTNGKTTTSYLIESILKAAGRVPGVIGTVNNRYKEKIYKTSMTTPESLELMRTFRSMSDSGVSDVVMEVSSHALSQGRTNDCPFSVVVFTNFSRDHLDYHSSLNEYFETKALLFKKHGNIDESVSTTAVINVDDPKGSNLLELTEFPSLTYGFSKESDIRAGNIRIEKGGLTAEVVTPKGEIEIRSDLIGNYNLYNILAATATALSLGIDLEDISHGISMLPGVPGRLELVKNNANRIIVVDYAHTPDALEKAILALKPIYRRIITVFGCGGDRDRGKRRQMGFIAGNHSDFVFITSDNPRTEDPLSIAMEIEEGVRESGLEKNELNSREIPDERGYVVNIDRRRAITQAVLMADNDSAVLIAGKGHEDYQIIGKEKLEFDDRKVAAEAASGGH